MPRPPRPDPPPADPPPPPHSPKSSSPGRVGLALLVLRLCACSAVDAPPSPEPQAPEGVDRESWGVHLELHGRASGMTIAAPYIVDLADVQLTRADSGATVSLNDSVGVEQTRIEAERLLIDHRGETIAFSGTVVAVAHTPQVTVRADTLAWDRVSDSLTFAAGADLRLPDGRLRAAALAGGSDLAAWRATGVRSRLRGGEDGDSVDVVAATASLRVIDDAVQDGFDSVAAAWRGRRFASRHGEYLGAAQQIRLRGGVTLQDSSRRLQADEIDVDLARSSFAARGGVHASGETVLWADTLGEDDAGGWRVSGTPARVAVDDRQVRAERLFVSAGTDTVTAAGGVAATEGDRRIEADSLVLTRATDAVEAFGAVTLAAADVEGDLRAGRLLSAERGQRLLLWDGAQLTRRRAAGEALSLAADSIGVDRGTGRLTGTGHFALRSPPSVELRAERGIYRTAGDSAGLTGSVEFLYDAEESHSRLQADTCGVELVDGEAVGITWPLALSGRLEDVEQTSWIRAAAGAATLADGRLQGLALEGEVEVTHRGRSGARVSRFTAQSMDMRFDAAGVLRSVVAEGQAHVRSRLVDASAAGEDEVSMNDVGGERLEVDLEGGAVVAVRVIDSVEGRYQPPAAKD